MKHESLRQDAYLMLRSQILSYEYKPSDLLSESQLALKLGISRTPVRAALEALESDGLVRRHSNTGFFVEHITPHMISDILEVRTAIECYSVMHPIIDRNGLRWRKFEALFKAFTRIKELPDDGRWLLIQEADRLFHREIVLRSGNQVALEVSDRVELRFARYRALAWEGGKRYHVGAADHLAIVQAIQAGDLEQASTLLKQHLISGKQHLISLMPGPQHAVQIPPLTPGEGPIARWLDDPLTMPASARSLFGGMKS